MNSLSEAFSAITRGMSGEGLLRVVLSWSLDTGAGNPTREELGKLRQYCDSAQDPKTRILILELLVYEEYISVAEAAESYFAALAGVEEDDQVSEDRLFFVENLLRHGVSAERVLQLMSSSLSRKMQTELAARISVLSSSPALGELLSETEERARAIRRNEFLTHTFVLMDQFACSHYENFLPSIKYESIEWALDDWPVRSEVDIDDLREGGVISKEEGRALSVFIEWFKEFLVSSKEDSSDRFRDLWIYSEESRAARQKLSDVLFKPVLLVPRPQRPQGNPPKKRLSRPQRPQGSPPKNVPKVDGE